MGYSGIKVELVPYQVSGETYLGTYADFIKAIGERSGGGRPPSLTIMVSGDTDAKTRKLLDENDNFGLDIDIITQNKVSMREDRVRRKDEHGADSSSPGREAC